MGHDCPITSYNVHFWPEIIETPFIPVPTNKNPKEITRIFTCGASNINVCCLACAIPGGCLATWKCCWEKRRETVPKSHSKFAI